MKKLFENKLIIGGICIILAAVLAFLILPKMYQKKEKTIMICRLQGDVAAGTKIEPEMIKQAEVGSFGLPETVVKNPDEIVGKYAKVAMTADDYLFASRFADYVTDEKIDKMMAEGKKLMAVTMSSNAASVANQLRSGDIVTVSYYADYETYIEDELRGIEVYSVENDKAKSVEEVQDEDDNADNIAATVTLIVTEEQALRLVNAEYSGKIHLLLESRGVVQ